MRKVHFRKNGGRWFSYYDRQSSGWSFPITRGDTLTACRDRLVDYRPGLLGKPNA